MAGREEGAYLNRYVTDPAMAGQPPPHFHRNPPGCGDVIIIRETVHAQQKHEYSRKTCYTSYFTLPHPKDRRNNDQRWI
jgi:hypothetical protein